MNSSPNTIGDHGETNIISCLNEIAYVNKYEKDIGLDFYCELRKNPSVSFYIQAKGTSKPKRDESYIETPYPIKLQKIETYWLKKAYPVFVIVSDISCNNEAFYLLINYHTLNNPSFTIQRKNGNEVVFRIPLKNKIKYQIDNEQFCEVVEKNQPENGKTVVIVNGNDTNLLEIMRGSDQSKQIEVMKIFSDNLFSYKLKFEFIDSLRDIFINCKDRITQYHVLNLLVLLKDRKTIYEIPKQVQRNHELMEYSLTVEHMRYTYTSFLFSSLKKLDAPKKIYDDIKHFIDTGEENLIRDVIRTYGELGIVKGIGKIFHFFKDSRKEIRWEAYNSLSMFKEKTIKNRLTKIIKSSNNYYELASAIYCCGLVKLRNKEVINAIKYNINNRNPLVRESVARYFGVISDDEKQYYLKALLFDDCYDVRMEALRALVNIKIINIENFEEEIHRKFQESDDLLFKSDLLSALFRLCTNYSITFIKNVIRNERNYQEYEFINIYNEECKTFIELGADSIRTLVRLSGNESIPFLLDCLNLKSPTQYKIKLIISLGDLKDDRVIPELEKLLETKDDNLKNWTTSILNSIKRIE